MPSAAPSSASSISPRVRFVLIRAPTPTARSFENDSPNATAHKEIRSPATTLPFASPAPAPSASVTGTAKTAARPVRSLRKSNTKSFPSEIGYKSIRPGSNLPPPPKASGISAHIMNMTVKMKNRNRNPSSAARSRATSAPAGSVRKYAPTPIPNANSRASARPANIPSVAATRPTTALRERIEFLNSAHFNHTSAKS